MFTLIMTIFLYGGASGVAVSTASMPIFRSLVDCQTAASEHEAKIKAKISGAYVVTSCVSSYR